VTGETAIFSLRNTPDKNGLVLKAAVVPAGKKIFMHRNLNQIGIEKVT
jgi:hypothetical protein